MPRTSGFILGRDNRLWPEPWKLLTPRLEGTRFRVLYEAVSPRYLSIRTQVRGFGMVAGLDHAKVIVAIWPPLVPRTARLPHDLQIMS